MAKPDMIDKLSAEGQKLFHERLLHRTFPKGKLLISKGDTVSGAYFVLKGRLRVYSYTPNGKEATLYTIEPGETCVLALNSMFNNILYPAWVASEEETELGVLPGNIYRSLFARESAIQDLTVRGLSTAVFRLMEELEQVHAQRLDQRLASFLLGRATANNGVVFNTQQEIAAHIGTTREVIARLLCDFSNRGWVETKRGQVKVCEPKPMAALLEPCV